MPVKKYVIDGTVIQSAEAFYDEIAKVLPLPDYFGRNLDALADVLTTDIEGPFEIIWEQSRRSKKALRSDYTKIVVMLKRVAGERDDFRVTFKE